MKINSLHLALCCTILIQLSCNKATIVYREQDRINGTDVRISKGAERGIYYAITDITTKSTGKRHLSAPKEIPFITLDFTQNLNLILPDKNEVAVIIITVIYNHRYGTAI
ncbi:MAG: hypothetical protein J0L99_05925 [Chitinophagales bacterium]|nr:hypothetical protein [Chitinophagales bacterium]